MALQLKGLRANVSGLRGDIDDLTNLAVGGREQAAVLKSHLGDIKTEIAQHVSDIEFTANVLGNSGGSSNEPAPPVVSQAVVQALPQPEVQQAAQGSILGVGQADQAQHLTFRAEAEQQIAAGHKP